MAPAAFLSSALVFADKAPQLKLPPAASFPTAAMRAAAAQLPRHGEAIAALHTALRTSAPIQIRDTKATYQSFWSEFIHLQSKQTLLSKATARSQSRLRCLSDPLSGAWLTPSQALGLTFSPPEFSALIRWRLGQPIRPGQHLHHKPTSCTRCGERFTNDIIDKGSPTEYGLALNLYCK